jgi:phage gp36-like protein
MYADAEYYINTYKGITIPGESLEKALKNASRHIDTLTYNRIVGRGFDNLTQFQQNMIKEVCCQMADFETENEEVLNSILQSYSVNGVTMTFGGNSWNVKVQNGVAIKADLYELLQQTGLCCRSLGV